MYIHYRNFNNIFMTSMTNKIIDRQIAFLILFKSSDISRLEKIHFLSFFFFFYDHECGESRNQETELLTAIPDSRKMFVTFSQFEKRNFHNVCPGHKSSMSVTCEMTGVMSQTHGKIRESCSLGQNHSQDTRPKGPDWILCLK